MLTKRIIPCLDIKDGRTVKGINFVNLRDAGDPVELARQYAKQNADELVFLDISATEQKRKTLADLVRKVAQAIDIPFTVGGGISSVDDVAVLLQNGADKVSINSAAVKEPELINKLAAKFGSQCIVVAIDAKQINGKWMVHLVGGKVPTRLDLFEWAKEVASRNITVNTISPGFIDTDMTEKLKDEQKQQLINAIPLGRMGSAEELAKVVCFLASEDASYITGENINVNGGLYM